MASAFAMRIVHLPSGQYVQFAPNSPVEAQLIEELCDRVSVKGIGVGRTTAHVVEDVRTAFNELLMDLKKQV